ncbi:ABC transporter ATP-binding protein [Alsobacter metallidurans]|uniref:ABC transporter ATP-binding protein n=1 Tax=Alsobacter metallidurans TaxID=340221 RepID=A0A917I8I8_9HYPH|nr:ABC transporter ATP-binding protein [Alsobacter metallidurans]GGH24176.1 ABC transporter ATP-binding protein [Alsobacter metallidurans]
MELSGLSSPVKIAVRGLTIDYPGAAPAERQRVLDGVDIDLHDGEFLCVVGPSGCGKSTLISAIAGFLTPEAGSISLDGKRVQGPGADRGVVFQEYALLPWRSVLDNVALGLKIRGMRREEREAKARHFLELVGLADVAAKYPHQLSGGMKQRAAVARTLTSEPEIVLMDEPFAAIDAQNRLILQEEVLRLWSTLGLTILFVTHSVDEAVFLGDRVIVMAPHPGRVASVVAVDIPRERRRWPAIGSDPDFIRLRDDVLARVRAEHGARRQ